MYEVPIPANCNLTVHPRIRSTWNHEYTAMRIKKRMAEHNMLKLTLEFKLIDSDIDSDGEIVHTITIEAVPPLV